MAASPKSRDISAKKAVEIIRGPLTNKEIMAQFKISTKGYADLLKQLLQRGLLTENDLKNRGIAYKVTKKEPTVQKATPKPVPLAPPPDEEDGDFLDTVTLTEMLTFKVPGEAAGSEPEPSSEEEVAEMQDKKVKFSLTGLFKKGD